MAHKYRKPFYGGKQRRYYLANGGLLTSVAIIAALISFAEEIASFLPGYTATIGTIAGDNARVTIIIG